MIIVRQQGRLGNQMFQYALYRKLELSGKNVKLDTTDYSNEGNLNALHLFPIAIQYSDKQENELLGDCLKDLFHKGKRKLFGRKKTHFRELEMKFYEEILACDNLYLEGFWQTEKYFSDIREDLLQQFVFPEVKDESNIAVLSQIRNQLSVSVHIRRGDYIQPHFREIYGNICTEEYYKKAIQYFENQYDNPHFFVFTDDPEWVEENIKIEHATYITHNVGNTYYCDLYLMSQCKHNVIANSSFSWWGAWLNQNQHKEVIAPSKWMNIEKTPDIWCEGWRKI